jgi:hypothetical protein
LLQEGFYFFFLITLHRISYFFPFYVNTTLLFSSLSHNIFVIKFYNFFCTQISSFIPNFIDIPYFQFSLSTANGCSSHEGLFSFLFSLLLFICVLLLLPFFFFFHFCFMLHSYYLYLIFHCIILIAAVYFLSFLFIQYCQFFCRSYINNKILFHNVILRLSFIFNLNIHSFTFASDFHFFIFFPKYSGCLLKTFSKFFIPSAYLS